MNNQMNDMNNDACCQAQHAESINNDTQSQCAALSAQLQTCQKELADWKEKSLRSYADFENFKRRMEKERAQWMSAAQKDILLSVLPIVDDVERALIEVQKKEKTPEMDVWFSGFSMIAQGLQKMLKQWQVTEITENRSFNPELHEAIVSVESAEIPSGEIVQVLQKGYKLGDDVLRPAKVSVAK